MVKTASCVKPVSFVTVIGLLVCMASLPGTAGAGDFFFKDGDVVAVMGDSITEQHLYSNYLEMWTLSRFPAWKLEFHNVGIGGDRSPGGNESLQARRAHLQGHGDDRRFRHERRRLFAFQSAGLQGLHGRAAGDCQAGQGGGHPRGLADAQPGREVGKRPGAGGLQRDAGKVLGRRQELATAEGEPFVDQFHPFVAVQDKARAANPANRIGGGDAVHPGPPGQAVMAWAILKGLGFPRLVSAAEIDAAAGKVAKADNCKVDEVAAKDGGLKFQRLDQALPFFPAEAKSILRWAPIREELNEYGLKVTGLKAGQQYDILVDGKKVAQHSGAELAGGLDLAAAVLETGPIAEQVNAGWKALTAKNQFHHDRIFNAFLRNPPEIPDWLGVKPDEVESKRQAAFSKRLAQYTEMQQSVRQALAPRTHRFEIVAAK